MPFPINLEPHARSRYVGYFYLTNAPSAFHTKPQCSFNGSILVTCKTLKGGVSSAAEAETGGVFHNGQTSIIIRRALEAFGHSQPPTPLLTVLCTPTLNKGAQKFGICVGIGCETNPRIACIFFGKRALESR